MRLGPLAWLLAAALALAGCGDELVCGEDTRLAGDVCQPAVELHHRCGRFTVWNEATGLCELESPPLECDEQLTEEIVTDDGTRVCQCRTGP